MGSSVVPRPEIGFFHISDEEVALLMRGHEEGDLMGWTLTPDEEWLEHQRMVLEAFEDPASDN
jgi:hypothetical protein